MDPLSAFGVAVNVIQLVDYSSRLVSGARQIHHSFDGELEEHTELKLVTDDLSKLAQILNASIESQEAGETLRPHENDEEILDHQRKRLEQQKRIALDTQRLATELLSTLNKLKSGSSNKTWNSIRQALLTIWRRDKIEGLERRLDRLRQEMVTNMVSSIQDQVRDKNIRLQADLDAIQNNTQSIKQTFLTKIEDNKADLQGIQHNTRTIGQAFLANIEDSKKWREELVETIHENGWQSFQNHGIFQASVEVSGEAQEKLEYFLEKKLIQRLRFADMQDRHDQVAEAHKATFQWIFEDPKATGKPWSNFENWLKSGTSLYWITGKPASGKSTLMKFIYHDLRTLDLLRSWAGDSELCTAVFFFWISGSKMQKTQTGLVRSLLAQILQEDSSLVPLAFPDRWEIFKLFGEDRYEWRWTELVRALKTIVSGQTSSKTSPTVSKKYCFFIDGLDEFDGDSTDLLHLVLELESFPNVKLCVSSRPWMIFTETFHRKPSLLLEDLTYPDIKGYVHSSFHNSRAFLELEGQDPEYADSLLERICQKASGVFLWVRLVVSSLTTGLMQGDRVSDLQRRLDAMPPDLERFFQQMLDGLDPLYRAHASQLFQIVRVAKAPFTLLQLSFAETEDPELVFRAETTPLEATAVVARCKITRRRIMSRGRGLLEIVGPGKSLLDRIDPAAFLVKDADNIINVDSRADSIATPTNDSQTQCIDIGTADSCAKLRIDYVHRTAHDFLESAGVWNMVLQQSDESFDPYVSLCRGAVLELKALRLDSLARPYFFLDSVDKCFSYALEIENHGHNDRFRLLDELVRVATELANHTEKSLDIDRVTYRYNKVAGHISLVILHLVAIRGMALYVKYRITQGRSDIEEQLWLMALALMLIVDPSQILDFRKRFSIVLDVDFKRVVSTLQVLVDHGVSPSQSFPTAVLSSRYGRKPPEDCKTPWQALLSVHSPSDRVDGQAWLEVFELFVRSEATGEEGEQYFSVDQWVKSSPQHANSEKLMAGLLSSQEIRPRLKKAGITVLSRLARPDSPTCPPGSMTSKGHATKPNPKELQSSHGWPLPNPTTKAKSKSAKLSEDETRRSLGKAFRKLLGRKPKIFG